MANVSCVKAVWSGFTGAPGYSSFYFNELTDAASRNAAGAAVRAFFQSLSAHFLVGWSIQVQSLVQSFDIGTGKLTGEGAMSTVPGIVNGVTVGTTVWAGGTGYVVNWLTGAIHNGRKVRGRTFIVPAVSTCFQNDGTVLDAVATTAQNAGNTLIADASTEFGVYARYWNDATPPVQTGGGFSSATGVLVPNRAAQLRTRRS